MTTTPDQRPIRVLLVDDQPLFRRALGQLLAQQPGFEVLGEAGHGLQAVELTASLAPDVVVMDIEMPVMDGLTALDLIKTHHPGTKVVMLTVDEDDDHLLEAIRRGTDGYLLKDLRPEDLYDMLRSVMRNETPVSPALVGRLLAELHRLGRTSTVGAPAPEPPPEAQLSQRELEILQCVAQGMSNKEIGARLSITEGTVKNHVHNALHKLKMDNRIQAAAYIVRQGLGAPPKP